MVRRTSFVFVALSRAFAWWYPYCRACVEGLSIIIFMADGASSIMVVEVGSYCFGYGIGADMSSRGGGSGDGCGKSYRRNYVAERRIRSSSISSQGQDGASSSEEKHQYNKHTSSTSFASALISFCEVKVLWLF